MSIYARPTKSLMTDWVKEHLKPGQTFTRSDVSRWFSEHYPNIKRTTVNMHVDGMSTNNPNRKHHPSIKPGSGHDLFYKLGPDQFRLWNQETDPLPLYKQNLIKQAIGEEASVDAGEGSEEEVAFEATREFAFERDLRNYLVKNLGMIEPGLHLYDEEGITGIEFEVGGRFIDVLAVDKNGGYVVIELKVSRGYDRVIGQLLRYMGWVQQNMETTRPVRGMIVANEITSDLKLAASRMPDVRLIEYRLSFELKPI